jgi:hypothetical protein
MAAVADCCGRRAVMTGEENLQPFLHIEPRSANSRAAAAAMSCRVRAFLRSRDPGLVTGLSVA